MAKELILAKYGEMALKGLNRGTFEDILMKNLRRRLKKFGVFKLTRAQSTIYMEPLSEDIDLDEVLEHLQCVFGIAALCRACVCEKTMGDISAKAVPYLDEVLSGANTLQRLSPIETVSSSALKLVIDTIRSLKFMAK